MRDGQNGLPGHTQRRTLYRYVLIWISLIIIAGILSTLYTLQRQSFAIRDALRIDTGLLLMNVVILAGVLIRFFKWQFFLRVFGVRTRIRPSLAIYLASLFVNLFFPFWIGEMAAKAVFLRREGQPLTARLIGLLLLERSLDVGAVLTLGLLAGVALDSISVSTVIMIAAIAITLLAFLFAFGRSNRISGLVSCFVIGLAGWAATYSLYFGLAAELRASVTPGEFSSAFTGYILSYPATPMGVLLPGRYLHQALAGFVDSPTTLIPALIDIRIASILPLLVFGGVALHRLVRRPAESGAFHFDEIAEGYAANFPEWVRERLVDRKCRMMIERLPQGQRLIGLDIGGGEGWSTSRMTDLTGARLILVERSLNQARCAIRRDARIRAVVADIRALPFREGAIDFAYSVNVIHHLPGREEQVAAFNAVASVLKRGGRFFLHEINTRNPLFDLYMSYIFPLLKSIDEGTEHWLEPAVDTYGRCRSNEVIYFTFVPEFIGERILRILSPLERRLESSRLKHFSAHFFRPFDVVRG